MNLVSSRKDKYMNDAYLHPIAIVDQILALKQNDPEADISALEGRLDIVIARLYGISNTEVNA